MTSYEVRAWLGRNANAVISAVALRSDGCKVAEFDIRARWLTPDSGDKFFDVAIGTDDLDFPQDVRKMLRVRVDGEVVYDINLERGRS